jgi:acyl-[acyl-carrier-protein]-phospholipid O-acyltransferase/long-chain-fatty-acid--[acyl-carrier-protein] ligase
MQRAWRRSFWALFGSQFQAAFSANAFEFLVIFLVATLGFSAERSSALRWQIQALYAVPFILFSMAGGYLADRYSKRSVVLVAQAGGVPLMALALLGLWSRSLPVLLVAIFLIGLQGALFGPAKYGLIPELLPHEHLSWGNGVLALGTFTAIILGTFGASQLSSAPAGAGLVLLALAVAGWLVSYSIERVPAAGSARRLRFNFVAELAGQLRTARSDRVLLLALAGSTAFWFVGAMVRLNALAYAGDELCVGPAQAGLLLAALAVGIGVGSFAAGVLSGNKIEYGLIPLGAAGMTVCSAVLALGGPSVLRAGLAIAGLGFSGGFFYVPVNALLQHRPAPERKGEVLAAANLLSFVAVFLSWPAGLLALAAGLGPRGTFLALTMVLLLSTAYLVALMPEALLRLLLWFATHSIYRIRVEGGENVPVRGGALFVSNHLSFVDALLLGAATDRRVRFVMHQEFYERPLVRPFARLMGAIPISSKLRPRDLIRSLREASDSIRAGRVVCIFAEGQITRIGQLLPFRRGLERIMKDVNAPIIPVHLDGVWGSLFSFDRGRFFWKLPRRIPYPVTVSFGRPMAASSTAFEVRQAVQELGSAAWVHRKKRMEPLHRAFVRAARRNPLRFAMADGRVPRLSAGGALAGAIMLGRRLRRVWLGQNMVGILLPPSVPGALVNFAALLGGKIPVNLNYTVSSETLASCARQCDLRTVVTSRAFLEKVHLDVPGEAVFLEDVAAGQRLVERVAALVMGFLLPVGVVERVLGRGVPARVDDLATVIFSSGSTGNPKGVMLTHCNIGSNVEQLGQVFALGGRDRVLGVLPFFHSFGFTGTFALPLTLGVGVVFHPNPLDANAVGALVGRYAATFLVATPTFLQAYMRRVEPEDFGSLEYVLVGAEKLPERLAQAFEDRFGIRPLEAYGCTECAPGVTVNTRDFRAPGFRQVGGKRGRIGQPLPGVSVRIVHPETMEPLPYGDAGLLLVRGPNVMTGYLGQPVKTAEVLRDGWYVTGDIAALDEDGFLTITDRLSRFSKIGGEMVPHVKIEERLHELAGITEQSFAVTGVPDEKKGERLVVLHTLPDGKVREVIEQLGRSGLPNLWLPRPNAVFRIDALPYLGTGKLDLRALRERALELSRALDREEREA